MSAAGARSDAAIVGGGVIGLAVAWELARRDLRAVVFERDRPGAGATRASAGMLTAVSEAETEEPTLVELALESLARYPDFVADVEEASGQSCGYGREATLWIALNRDQEAELDHLRETLRRRRLPVEPRSAEEVARLEPRLSGRVLSGLLVAADHRVQPRALVSSLARAVERAGGTIRSGAAVEEILVEAGRAVGVAGRTGAGEPFEARADLVVLAAGAWSTTSIRSPLSGLSVRPVKGQLLRLRGERLLGRAVRTPDVYFVPGDGGELVVGATVEEQGFDARPTAGAVLDLLRFGWQALPAISELEIAEVSVGFRPALRDHLPVIGPTEVPGLLVATGHYRKGLLLAPVTAHHVAELVATGRLPREAEPFRAERAALTGAPASGPS